MGRNGKENVFEHSINHYSYIQANYSERVNNLLNRMQDGAYLAMVVRRGKY